MQQMSWRLLFSCRLTSKLNSLQVIAKELLNQSPQNGLSSKEKNNV